MSKSIQANNFANISVVIPAYNEAERLAECLQSILDQKIKPKELILVDNNSTDQTAQIAQTFAPKFGTKNIKYKILSEPTRGIAPARNRGFFATTQSIIASTDADGRPHPDWIEKIDQHFKTHDSLAVTGIPIMTDSNWLVRFVTEHNYYYYLSQFLIHFTGYQHLSGATFAIKSKVFRELGGFDPTQRTHYHLDDSELASRVSLLGPVRIDTTIRVDTSFRRHNSFKKITINNWERIRTLYQIAQRRKQLQKNNQLIQKVL